MPFWPAIFGFQKTLIKSANQPKPDFYRWQNRVEADASQYKVLCYLHEGLLNSRFAYENYQYLKPLLKAAHHWQFFEKTGD